MQRLTSNFVRSTFKAVLTGIVVVFMTSAAAQAKSGCITCHTDEDMLEQNLAKVQAKKSAKQTGAG